VGAEHEPLAAFKGRSGMNSIRGAQRVPFQQILRETNHVPGQGDNLVLLPGMAIEELTRRAGRSLSENSLACATRNGGHDPNRRDLCDDD
jgi:hypothetical protein